MTMSTYNIYLETYPHISPQNHAKFLEIHTYYSKYSNGSLSPTQNKTLPMRGAIYNFSCFSKTQTIRIFLYGLSFSFYPPTLLSYPKPIHNVKQILSFINIPLLGEGYILEVICGGLRCCSWPSMNKSLFQSVKPIFYLQTMFIILIHVSTIQILLM